jgi:hypothetical protein
MTLEQLLAEAKTLTPDEQQQLCDALNEESMESLGKSKKSGRTASGIHLTLQAREPSQACQTALWHFQRCGSYKNPERDQ